MRDPLDVIADAIQDVLDVEPQSLAVRASSAVLAALRAEYGAWMPDADSITRWTPIIPVPMEATDG